MKNPAKQRAVAARWAKHPWTSFATRETLVRMYVSERQTQREIAAALQVSLKMVQTAMRRLQIAPRRATPRFQSGATSPSWKGGAAGYQAKHLRVQRLKGKPKACERCGTAHPRKHYDWANLTGNYDDPTDYQRMCRSCHRKYDNARRRAGA